MKGAGYLTRVWLFQDNLKQNDWFFHDYGIEESEEDVKRASSKPKDHRLLFGGNSDDDFMFGIKITK